MKDLFNKVKSGNLGDIGNTLQSTLGGKLGSFGDTINTMGNSAKTAAQNNPLQGVGGLLGSAAVGGLLGALFTGKKTKKIAKGALKVGGTAVVGALAWKFYQKWSQNKDESTTQMQPQQYTIPQPPQNAPLTPADTTALILLEAMVYAARADGHIDEEEKVTIHNAVQVLFPGQQMVEILDALLEKPIDPVSLASRVCNAEEARDLYRLSCAAINIDSYMERSYLDGLANALQLNETDKVSLEQEAFAMRQSMAS